MIPTTSAINLAFMEGNEATIPRRFHPWDLQFVVGSPRIDAAVCRHTPRSI